jgi:hypothetical protein
MPSDQTDLDQQLLFILKDGGGMIHETQSDWLYRGAAARRVWAPTHVSVKGGPHLLGGGFSSVQDYTFSVCGPFSLCKPDMWTIFGHF